MSSRLSARELIDLVVDDGTFVSWDEEPIEPADGISETYAAELAAQVGADPYPLLVGLIDKDAVRKFYGLVYLLDGYGLTLRQRHRAGGDGVFVYAERKLDAPSEFDGAVVTETVTETVPYAFPQAA